MKIFNRLKETIVNSYNYVKTGLIDGYNDVKTGFILGYDDTVSGVKKGYESLKKLKNIFKKKDIGAGNIEPPSVEWTLKKTVGSKGLFIGVKFNEYTTNYTILNNDIRDVDFIRILFSDFINTFSEFSSFQLGIRNADEDYKTVVSSGIETVRTYKTVLEQILEYISNHIVGKIWELYGKKLKKEDFELVNLQLFVRIIIK